ncbi:hypothetical protein [Bosea vestrisii]|uniref:Uncharacterized protein n=1 Tax=Bosea vestrisii TaxID=151416 RepID=A0ABW0HD34_9HYPH
MSEQHSRAIVRLLTAMLCVMVFFVVSYLAGTAWAGFGLFVVGFVILFLLGGAVYCYQSIRKEVVTARDQGKPWIGPLLTLPSMVLNFVVFGIGGLVWLLNNMSFRDALTSVPGWWIPVVGLLGGFAAEVIEGTLIDKRNKSA